MAAVDESEMRHALDTLRGCWMVGDMWGGDEKDAEDGEGDGALVLCMGRRRKTSKGASEVWKTRGKRGRIGIRNPSAPAKDGTVDGCLRLQSTVKPAS